MTFLAKISRIFMRVADSLTATSLSFIKDAIYVYEDKITRTASAVLASRYAGLNVCDYRKIMDWSLLVLRRVMVMRR